MTWPISLIARILLELPTLFNEILVPLLTYVLLYYNNNIIILFLLKMLEFTLWHVHWWTNLGTAFTNIVSFSSFLKIFQFDRRNCFYRWKTSFADQPDREPKLALNQTGSFGGLDFPENNIGEFSGVLRQIWYFL